MKSNTSRTALLLPNDTSFQFEVSDIPHRLVCSVQAREKMGKSTFGLTAPPPIAYLNFDLNEEGVLHRAVGKGIAIAHAKYHVEAPVGASAEVLANAANTVWKRFRNDYAAALASPKIRSIVIDTGTQTWSVLRLARFGKLTQVPPILYAQVNAEMSRILEMSRQSTKNVIWLHRVKEEWVETVNSQGRKESRKTGNLELAGYKDAPFEVQCNIQLDRNDAGVFTAEVLNCTLNDEVTGKVFEGPKVNFRRIAAAIFGDTPQDWK